MTARARKANGLESSLKNLTISSTSTKKPTKSPIAESSEEAASPSSNGSSTPSRPSTPVEDNSAPGPPPPTPSSPTHFRKKSTDWASLPSSYADYSAPSSVAKASREEKRPDKTNAAAGRMIAGALGMKSLKKTEEGKAYEKAMRDKERKRRERAKEEQERAEREGEEARRAVWED